MINIKSILIIILVLACNLSLLKADIYFYQDENGVLHFTNSPESLEGDYTVFIRDSVRKWRTTTFSPTKYDRLISEAARRYGVDFTLIKAVIKAESDFNPQAVSPKGARGLMQIMPKNFKNLGIYNPFDPRQNIMAGTKYLKRMINRFESLSLALAAYNAGPTVVSSYNKIPPYKETQKYVKRVLRFYRSYNGYR